MASQLETRLTHYRTESAERIAQSELNVKQYLAQLERLEETEELDCVIGELKESLKTNKEVSAADLELHE